MYSGGLIGPPGTTWDDAGNFAGTPVFLGCSDIDAHIPKARVDESADVFARMGAAVTKRIYPGMGHLVNDGRDRSGAQAACGDWVTTALAADVMPASGWRRAPGSGKLALEIAPPSARVSS